jgi:CRP-like cAMP-binding protein
MSRRRRRIPDAEDPIAEGTQVRQVTEYVRHDGSTLTSRSFGSPDALRALSPFESLDGKVLESIFRAAKVRDFTCGDTLFRQGEANDEVLYVLTGLVELQRDGRRIGVVKAGSDEARRPLSKSAIHWHGAEVISRHAQVLAIDATKVDILLTLEQTGAYKVLDIQQDDEGLADLDDWMVQVLRSKAFRHISPANIQAMFMRLERVDHCAGDVVIHQGDPGDYFYVIARGRCKVERAMATGTKSVILAELGVGASFGEEALIANCRRSATVSMLTDGTLMRLNKADFQNLCGKPVIRELSLEQARTVIRQGGCWLDVRLPSEVKTTGIRGALSVPLYMLRLRMDSIPKSKPVVVVCDTGRRSAVAAFVLAQNGHDVSILKGGLFATNPDFIGDGTTRRLRALNGSTQRQRSL